MTCIQRLAYGLNFGVDFLPRFAIANVVRFSDIVRVGLTLASNDGILFATDFTPVPF